jgi:SNF2 family DNA or RNA helicase
MGKTIQMISLLLSEPRGKPTLIVAPTVALLQWKNEIEKHAEGLTVSLFYGKPFFSSFFCFPSVNTFTIWTTSRHQTLK